MITKEKHFKCSSAVYFIRQLLSSDLAKACKHRTLSYCLRKSTIEQWTSLLLVVFSLVFAAKLWMKDERSLWAFNSPLTFQRSMLKTLKRNVECWIHFIFVDLSLVCHNNMFNFCVCFYQIFTNISQIYEQTQQSKTDLFVSMICLFFALCIWDCL